MLWETSSLRSQYKKVIPSSFLVRKGTCDTEATSNLPPPLCESLRKSRRTDGGEFGIFQLVFLENGSLMEGPATRIAKKQINAHCNTRP